jgi:hypothetical protein
MTAAVKEKNSPGVSAPLMTRYPPYQMAPMMPSAPRISISGSARLSARWSLRASRRRRSLMASNRSCWSASRPNALTILLPVKASCRTMLSSVIFSCDRLAIL